MVNQSDLSFSPGLSTLSLQDATVCLLKKKKYVASLWKFRKQELISDIHHLLKALFLKDTRAHERAAPRSG